MSVGFRASHRCRLRPQNKDQILLVEASPFIINLNRSVT
jgi:hypothetical protein